MDKDDKSEQLFHDDDDDTKIKAKWSEVTVKSYENEGTRA